ncbi:MAG: molybdenum cofactor guanylyltransferase [Actinobacteria bacterium]|nr:molybdenum cofactor guanylyltransferase [Actinomycetota bacterium]
MTGNVHTAATTGAAGTAAEGAPPSSSAVSGMAHMRRWPDSLTFVVLAGGRSSRFGSDKLMAPVRGQPLLQRVLAEIPAGFPTIVAGASFKLESVDLHGAVVVSESPSHGGPLAGLLAATDHIGTAGVLVIGGDMPNVVAGALRLAARFDPARPTAFVATDRSGHAQPLCSLIPVDVLREATIVFGDGRDRPLRALLDLARPQRVHVPDDFLSDIDRPEDLDRLQATVNKA